MVRPQVDLEGQHASTEGELQEDELVSQVSLSSSPVQQASLGKSLLVQPDAP